MNTFDIYVSCNDGEYSTRITVKGKNIKVLEPRYEEDRWETIFPVMIDTTEIAFDENILAIEAYDHNGFPLGTIYSI